ncbi:MAG TPA: hypothetical protein VGD40_05600 [Chryseosolibacter sp.]
MILYAGPLQVLYERGFLRYISYQDAEILRMIYFALRDENWDTCEHIITHEEKDISWETFRVTYDSVHRKNNEDLIRWKASIEGLPDSSIRFTIDGEVLKEIKKNRAGFCVLHPLHGVKGQPVQVTQPDGSTYDGQFPAHVEPRNPFKDVQKLKWRFGDRWFEVSFSGDVFETEDQRNWIDTSFKTFCTPADLPIPVTLQPGTKIHQEVHFRPLEKLQPITSHDATVIQLDKTGEATRLPAIGTLLSAENNSINAAAVDQLKTVKLDHLAIAVSPSNADWIAKFSQQCEAAYAIDLAMKVVLTLPQDFNNTLNQFSGIIQQNRLRVNEVLLLSEKKPVTDQKLIDHIPTLKEALPGIKWGVGTSGDFKDLNRNRFNKGDADFVSYSAHPQVHAFDDRTLIENIDGLRETGDSSSIIYPKAEIHLCPITLQKRSWDKADPRQTSDLAALWTFGAIRAIAEAKVRSATLFETTGQNGLLSNAGQPYPITEMLQKLLRFKNHEMIVLKNNEPLLADAMLFSNDSSTTLLLVNYTDDLQVVRYGRNEFQVPPLQLIEINLSGT